jgi:hypothetical protein
VDYWVNGAYIGQGQQTRPLTYQVPDQESNDPDSPWGAALGDLTKVEWIVTVSNPVGTSFVGRTIREQDGGPARAVADLCHYPGSPIPEWTQVSTGEASIETGNIYHDRIGFAPEAVNHYRASYHAPCDALLKQEMLMSMTPGQAFRSYLMNELRITVGESMIWVSRAGTEIGKVW